MIEKPVVTQIGIVVRDIESVIDAYCRAFGLERPTVIETAGPDETHATFEGQPTEARAKLAFFHMGQVDIELIEPIGGPSTWRTFLEEKGEGVHHIAFVTPDARAVSRSLSDQGIPVEQRGDFVGGNYTYLNSADPLKVRLELLEIFGQG